METLAISLYTNKHPRDSQLLQGRQVLEDPRRQSGKGGVG